jgi:hypothetical protein
MRITRLVTVLSALCVAPGLAITASADDFGHEYHIDLQTGDLESGKSGFGQGVGYAFYPVRVDTGDQPYAEAAFVRQAHFVAVEINGSSADRVDGSAHNWNYSVGGRYTLPGNTWYFDAALTRSEYEFNSFVLSASPDDTTSTTRFRLGGGMYFTPTTSVGLGIATSRSDSSATPDASSRLIDVYGKAVLPVGEDHVAMALTLTQASSEYADRTLNELNYDGRFSWYFTRALDVTLGFGRGFDFDYPLADYKTVDLAVNWFVEAELLVSARIQRQTWYNDDQFDSLSLRFGVRL